MVKWPPVEWRAAKLTRILKARTTSRAPFYESLFGWCVDRNIEAKLVQQQVVIAALCTQNVWQASQGCHLVQKPVKLRIRGSFLGSIPPLYWARPAFLRDLGKERRLTFPSLRLEPSLASFARERTRVERRHYDVKCRIARLMMTQEDPCCHFFEIGEGNPFSFSSSPRSLPTPPPTSDTHTRPHPLVGFAPLARGTGYEPFRTRRAFWLFRLISSAFVVPVSGMGSLCSRQCICFSLLGPYHVQKMYGIRANMKHQWYLDCAWNIWQGGYQLLILSPRPCRQLFKTTLVVELPALRPKMRETQQRWRRGWRYVWQYCSAPLTSFSGSYVDASCVAGWMIILPHDDIPHSLNIRPTNCNFSRLWHGIDCLAVSCTFGRNSEAGPGLMEFLLYARGVRLYWWCECTAVSCFTLSR